MNAPETEERATLLIIEDDAEAAQTLELLLEREGHSVVTAQNGREALGLLGLHGRHGNAQIEPDVILLDVLMEGPDAREVCRRIRGDERLGYIPIIIVTDLDAGSDEVKRLENSADDYICKLVKNEDLLARIRTQLRTKRLYDERKRAEEALRESKRQLESGERFITRILESIPSSVLVIDQNLRIVSVNRNFLQKMRRTRPNTLGNDIEEVFPPVLMNYTRLSHKVQEVFRTGEPVKGGQFSYRAPGLPTRIYYYHLFPLKHGLSSGEEAEERVGNVMLLMDDITEREQLAEEVRRAERHLAGVVECANDLVISLDPRGHIVTWNQAAEEISGRSSQQVKGESLSSLCVAEQRQEMVELLDKLAEGESIQAKEIELLAADDQQVPIAWSCSPMRGETGTVMGIVAVGRDLTERRQMQAQLIQSTKMASLGVMAGGIAHELRNPLAIISASAQLLQERPEDAHLRGESSQKIHAATQRASQIIENLLTFARPKDREMGEVDLHGALEETLSVVAHQMTLQNVTVERDFHPDLAPVWGNVELLQQVFTNLILNARDAMPEGGTLEVTTRDSKGGQVEIEFSDTGCGIPEENLSEIFDPFFTTMPVGEAVGLGLAISYSIIQQHQGTIEVESEVDEGSTFTVRLPAHGG